MSIEVCALCGLPLTQYNTVWANSRGLHCSYTHAITNIPYSMLFETEEVNLASISSESAFIKGIASYSNNIKEPLMPLIPTAQPLLKYITKAERTKLF